MFDVVIHGGVHLIVSFIGLFLALIVIGVGEVNSLADGNINAAATYRVFGKTVGIVATFIFVLIVLWALGVSFIA